MKFLLVCCVLLACRGTQVAGFLYDNIANWTHESEFCDECAQSPIHLIKNQAQSIDLPDFRFTNYDVRDTLKITNEGETIVVKPNKNLKASVYGGPHPNNIFQVEGIIFHWGSDGVLGSEHKIDYRKADAEIQIVHKNIDYPSVNEAHHAEDGFLIFSVLLKSTSYIPPPPGVKAVCDVLDNIRVYGTSVTVQSTEISSFIERVNTQKYFVYCGSMTVPPCTPNVLWIVFADFASIGYDCLVKLRKLKNQEGRALVNNFRPLQQPMDRQVFYRFKRSSG